MSELPFLMLLCAGVGIGRGFERVDRALNDRWYREYEQQAVRVLAVLILAGNGEEREGEIHRERQK